MREPLSDRTYRALLRVLPFDFRGDFGGEMEEVFREQRAEAAGPAAFLKLWIETTVDLLRTAPAEHLAILRQDVRYALRVMKREFGYVLLSILVLGLGIGASTALFSVLHAILLRPLPYANGERLVLVRQLTPRGGLPEQRFSVAEIEDFRAKNRTLSALAEYHSMNFMLLDPKNTESVGTGVVSSDFFDMFGVKPLLGRGFTADDDRSGAPPVLLMSYEYWKRRGADPNVVGTPVRMNDRSHTIIGVLPPMPQFPNENDVFMPTSACPWRSAPKFIHDRSSRMMLAFGLLKPDVTVNAAREDMARIAGEIAKQHPDVYNPEDTGYTAAADSLRDELTQRARPMLWLLMGASLLVLGIACANVANLTLARVGRREHELVVRTAVGAARARLLRQFLTEHLITALCAAAAGIVLAWTGMHVLTDFAARLSPRAREITLDRSVLLFAVALAMATSLFFGSISALAPRRHLLSGLSDASGPRGTRFRNVLVICQVALSFILLAGAGLLTRSLIRLHEVDPGFTAQNRLAVSINLSWSRPVADQHMLADQVLARVSALPHVISAALSSSFPFDPQAVNGGPWVYEFHAGDRPEVQTSAVRFVTSQYFDTLGVPIVHGRAFSAEDDHADAKVALVSESFARRYWADRDALGQSIKGDNGPLTIIGIAGNVKELGPARGAPEEIYLPVSHAPFIRAMVIRSSIDPAAAVVSIRQAIREVDPDIAVNESMTIEEARNDSIRVTRLTTNLLGLFAVAALAIAVTGIGGILALSVTRRGREIAIRMALGARSGAVLRMIVRQGMLQVAVGLAIGIAGALFLTGALRQLLFQITPTDPVTFIGVSLLLMATALIACLIPARRATRIAPSVALRSE